MILPGLIVLVACILTLLFNMIIPGKPIRFGGAIEPLGNFILGTVFLAVISCFLIFVVPLPSLVLICCIIVMAAVQAEWPLTFTLAALAVAAWWRISIRSQVRYLRSKAHAPAGACPTCQYTLPTRTADTPSADICPECGTNVATTQARLKRYFPA